MGNAILMPLRAVLFDFDGVIADTENHHVAAWQRTFGLMGWLIPDAVCAQAAERNDHDFLARIFAEKKFEDGDVEGWVARKQEFTLTMLADSPRVYPGVSALLERLKDKVALAVVTTTWRSNVATVLQSAGLGSMFELIIAKEDSKLLKPDPAPYRLALERLNVSPAEAVALEDSPNGLASAVGAGLTAIAVGHRRTQGPWVGSASYVKNFRDTERLLSLLGLAPV